MGMRGYEFEVDPPNKCFICCFYISSINDKLHALTIEWVLSDIVLRK